MIYADFEEEPVFAELVRLLRENYTDVTLGQQGDTWIWIQENDMKVEIDTFTALNFQVKSPASNANVLVHEVLASLQRQYHVFVYPRPELEAHEN